MEKPPIHRDCLKNARSHCFPDFQNCSRTREQKSTASDGAFRPIFKKSPDCSTFSARIACQQEREDGVHDTDSSSLEALYQKGFEDGRAQSCNQIQQALAPFVEQLMAALASHRQDMQYRTSTLQDRIMAFAVAIAEKVLHRSLTRPMQWDKEHGTHLNGLVDSAHPLTIHMNPDDYDALNRLSEGRLSQAIDQTDLRFRANPAVAPGTIQSDHEDPSSMTGAQDRPLR